MGCAVIGEDFLNLAGVGSQPFRRVQDVIEVSHGHFQFNLTAHQLVDLLDMSERLFESRREILNPILIVSDRFE